MRLGLLSDVHGNLEALRAAIGALRSAGVDGWVCAGDLVGYGPRPNECVEEVAGLGALTVAGNHDLVAIGALPPTSSRERVRRSHAFTRDVLREDVLAHLRGLPHRAEQHGVVVAHGSLDDPERYVSTPELLEQQLAQLGREHPAARYLVLGHTHRQVAHVEGAGAVAGWHRRPADLSQGRRAVLNPGSVGQSRQHEWPPRARAAVLDLERGRATALALRYDVRAVREDLRRAGLEPGMVHTPPSLRHTARRGGRRALGRLSAPARSR